MNKDELIQIHVFLLQLKKHLDNMVENNRGGEFQPYDRLNINPHQIHKSKREHKIAIFTLIKGIAGRLSNNNCYGLEKISNRFNQILECSMTKKEKELIKS